MDNLIILEKPLDEATMLEIRQQAITRQLHMITNSRGDIRLCSMILPGWKQHRVNIKPLREAA